MFIEPSFHYLIKKDFVTIIEFKYKEICYYDNIITELSYLNYITKLIIPVFIHTYFHSTINEVSSMIKYVLEYDTNIFVVINVNNEELILSLSNFQNNNQYSIIIIALGNRDLLFLDNEINEYNKDIWNEHIISLYLKKIFTNSKILNFIPEFWTSLFSSTNNRLVSFLNDEYLNTLLLRQNPADLIQILNNYISIKHFPLTLKILFTNANFRKQNINFHKNIYDDYDLRILISVFARDVIFNIVINDQLVAYPYSIKFKKELEISLCLESLISQNLSNGVVIRRIIRYCHVNDSPNLRELLNRKNIFINVRVFGLHSLELFEFRRIKINVEVSSIMGLYGKKYRNLRQRLNCYGDHIFKMVMKFADYDYNKEVINLLKLISPYINDKTVNDYFMDKAGLYWLLNRIE